MRAGISLGSNLGDRATHLHSAITSMREIADPSGPVLVSSFHETSPVDCPPDSPPFINAAVEIEWTESPYELLEKLQSIEHAHGRPAFRPVNSPRPLDLDLLYCGGLIINGPTLVLPHPRIAERSFVLEPLSEINPTLYLPQCSKSIAEMFSQILRN